MQVKRYLHSTRLKEKLISKIPRLQAHRRGKQVIPTTGEVITEAVLPGCRILTMMMIRLWYKLQDLFFKICLIIITNLNSILIWILEKIPSQ